MVVASDVGLNISYKVLKNIFGKVIVEGKNPVLTFYMKNLDGWSITFCIDLRNWSYIFYMIRILCICLV